MTLSRNLTDVSIIVPSRSQSKSPAFTNFDTLMLPRLQDSYARSGCSPQGLVASIVPAAGVGFERFISSMKTRPGSPVFHAFCAA